MRAFAALLLGALAAPSALAQPDPFTGEWEVKPLAWRADPPADSVQLALMRGGPGASVLGDVFPVRRLEGLVFAGPGAASASVADGPARFEVRADAGVIAFAGAFQGGRGMGSFAFTADPAFAAALEAWGLARPSAWEGLAFAVRGGRLVEVDSLLAAFRRHGVKPVSTGDLLRAVAQGVTPGDVEGLAWLGLGEPSARALVRLRTHGVTAGEVRAWQALGYAALRPDELVRLKNHGVTPAYAARANARLGRRLSADALVRLHRAETD